MLTPPAGLPESALTRALAQGWDLTTTSIEYRPVGWGSHHWEVTDAAGSRWFVTADELASRRLYGHEPLEGAFQRLRAALTAARDLRECGLTFVVAPVPARDGEPLVPMGDGFAVAVYPFIEGQTFDGGDRSPEHRRSVLGLVTAVHTAPAAARRHALADDLAVPCRDGLEAAATPTGIPACGPYARPAADLVRRHAAKLERLLARYDRLVAQARAEPSVVVLTHGEPHPGNTMLTADGWLLIDWDTALTAPPERDLWDLDQGDGTILAAYAEATGVRPRAGLLDLYRLRWDLTDLALDVSRFRRPHLGTDEDRKSWELLSELIEQVS